MTRRPCVTSPVGDEAFVAGKNHTVTWAATDDSEVDTIDIFYTTDGLDYQPINLGVPGNRDLSSGRFPLMEATTVEVKVVAHDEEPTPARI